MSGVLYCEVYQNKEPIKFEQINSISVCNTDMGFGRLEGKMHIDKDYTEFLSKRLKMIRSIDIYEKEESS